MDIPKVLSGDSAQQKSPHRRIRDRFQAHRAWELAIADAKAQKLSGRCEVLDGTLWNGGSELENTHVVALSNAE